MDYTEIDADVTNVIDGAGVQDSKLLQVANPLEVIFGELNSGATVSAEVEYVAVMDVYRELDDEEQAMYGGTETLDFSSVLLAGEDGEAEQEHVVNVSGGSLDHALAAFEIVESDGVVDLLDAETRSFEVQDGELVETTAEETTDEQGESE